MQSFTAQDTREILTAVPLFMPYLLLPGYAAGYFLDTFAFRSSGPALRLALSLLLSLALVPVTANLAARFVAVPKCAFWIAGISVLLTLTALVHEARATRSLSHRRSGGMHAGAIAGLAAAWICICTASFPDLQIGGKLWNSVLIYDGGLRGAFIDAVLRTGVPPSNPLCFFGVPIPSRYYYYWSTVCALPAVLGHLPARAVLAASSVWTGFALMAIIALFLRYFLGIRLHLRRWSLIGACLLSVTGLDLIPTAISWATQGFVRADMEWWDGTEIPSWIDSVLWTPHHVAGLLCCLMGLLLIWPRAQPVADWRSGRAADLLLASLAFASAAGLSVYLLFCFILFFAFWSLRLVIKGHARSAVPFLLAGFAATLLSLPLLHDLRQPAAHQMDAHSGKPAHLITTGLRTSGWIKAHTRPEHGLRRLPLLVLDLAATYVLEFGFFLVVAYVVACRLWRRRRSHTEAEIALYSLLLTATAVMTFLKSEAIRSNDLGMRSPLLAQFVLLLWAIPLVDGLLFKSMSGTERSPVGASTTVWLLRVTLILGAGASAYQLLLLRFAAPLDALAVSRAVQPIASLPVRLDGARILQLRRTEVALQPHLKAGTVVGFNVDNEDALLLLADTHAQIASSGPENCGTPFGGSQSDCKRTQAVLRSIFEPTAGALQSVTAACRSASIDVLLVQPSDPVWSDGGSWVWREQALVSSGAMRAIRCGGTEAPSPAISSSNDSEILR